MELDYLSNCAKKLLAELEFPNFLPDDFYPTELIETHLSLVIIGKLSVLKLRKPLFFPFCDHSQLAARWNSAISEVVLNRRLASEIYCGVASILNGHLSNINSEPDFNYKELPCGEPAVLMKKLNPSEQFSKLVTDSASDCSSFPGALATVLSLFHNSNTITAERLAELGMTAETVANNFAQSVRDNFTSIANDTAQLLEASSLLAIDRINHFSELTLKKTQEEISTRAKSGLIVDGHGDLRAEHVFFQQNTPTIIDCLEFSSELRTIDCLNDIAFLCMDLSYLQRRDLAEQLYLRYLLTNPSAESSSCLWRLYCCYRAMVRAKVSLYSQKLKIDSLPPPTNDTNCNSIYPSAASGLIALAASYVSNITQPFVLVIGGTMGCGKSTLAKYFQGLAHAQLIQSDLVRKSLFGSSDSDRSLAYGEDKYSPEATEQTYREMFIRAQAQLRHKASVILDASFSKRQTRIQAYKLARDNRATVLFVHCVCDSQLQASRLAARTKELNAISDGRIELLEQQTNAYQVPSTEESTITIDSGAPLAQQANAILDKLQQLSHTNCCV